MPNVTLRLLAQAWVVTCYSGLWLWGATEQRGIVEQRIYQISSIPPPPAFGLSSDLEVIAFEFGKQPGQDSDNVVNFNPASFILAHWLFMKLLVGYFTGIINLKI